MLIGLYNIEPFFLARILKALYSTICALIYPFTQHSAGPLQSSPLQNHPMETNQGPSHSYMMGHTSEALEVKCLAQGHINGESWNGGLNCQPTGSRTAPPLSQVPQIELI